MKKRVAATVILTFFLLGNVLPGVSVVAIEITGVSERSATADSEREKEEQTEESFETDEDNSSGSSESTLESEKETIPEKDSILVQPTNDESILKQPTKLEPNIASGTYGTVYWVITPEGTLYLKGGTLNNSWVGHPVPGVHWRPWASSVKRVQILEKINVGNGGANDLFADLVDVKEIIGLEKLDVSLANQFISTFAGMKSLTSVDISSWDMRNATHLNSMFSRCSSLTSIKGIERLSESRVTSVNYMFREAGLSTLDLSTFTLHGNSGTGGAIGMFMNMPRLTSLDLSSFDSKIVTASVYSEFFQGSNALSQIKLGPKFFFGRNPGLCEVPSNDVYTGRWVNVGSGTIDFPKGKNRWTSQEFMDNYDGSKDADTYVWEKRLNITTKQLEYPVGTEVTEDDARKFVDSVKYGDTTLKQDDYTVSIIGDSSSLDTVGTEELKLKIEVNGSNQSQEASAKAKVNWGSTIVVKNNKLSMVSTSTSLLHGKDGNPYLRANKGYGLDNAEFIDTTTNLTVYRGSEDAAGYIFDAYNSGGSGISLTTAMEKNNNKFRANPIKYGDVLKVDVRSNEGYWNGENTFISRNESLTLEAVGFRHTYYEMTPSGFRLLRMNQFTVNNDQKVSLNTSKEEMNKNIANFIHLPKQAENPTDFRMEFESVNTSSYGSKKSKINVFEKLAQGGEFKTSYEVSYTVQESLDVTTKQVIVPVGTKMSMIDASQFIEHVKQDGKELKENEYTASIVNTPNLDVLGTPEVKLKVVLNKNKDVFREASTKAQVTWGNTIVVKDKDFAAVNASVSLLEDKEGRPYLRANEGSGFPSDSKQIITTRPDFFVHRENDSDKALITADHYTYNQTPLKLAERYNEDQRFGGSAGKIKYGDVLKVRVQDVGNPSVSWNGTNTFVSRNEALTLETEGHTDAYYELTPSGYHLLRLNQFIVIDGQKVALNTSKEEMNKNISNFIQLPEQAENPESFKMEFASVDTATSGNKKGMIKVSEKLAHGGWFETTYEVSYTVEVALDVTTKQETIPVGTKLSNISANQFIEKVKLGDTELKEQDYTVSIINTPNLDAIGTPEVKVNVVLNNKDVSQEANTRAQVVWGNTIVAKDRDLSFVNASVSLLQDREGKPYLRANEGSGFPSSVNLSTTTNLTVYRGRDDHANQILDAYTGGISKTPRSLMNQNNRKFDDNQQSTNPIQYGDVLKIDVRKGNNEGYWDGANTFVSRNEALILETVGFRNAFYELTSFGYRLLRFNQFTVNNGQKVALNTTKEEMNKNIANFIHLPAQAQSPANFKMEFASVDTATSGNKKSIINVSEKLAHGGWFETTYEVSYIVEPEVVEHYYDTKGNQITESQTTAFEYGESFTPNPKQQFVSNGEIYLYKGWSYILPTADEVDIQDGIPAPTKVEKEYYYIYEKKDKSINITMPIEMLFRSVGAFRLIGSENYPIQNNSDHVNTKVSFSQFEEIESTVELLSSGSELPTTEEESAMLYLMVNNQVKISGLNGEVSEQTLFTLLPKASQDLSFAGFYFGQEIGVSKVEYSMKLKFEAISD